MGIPTAPISMILEETEMTNYAELLIDVQNPSRPFDEDWKDFQIADFSSQNLYDARVFSDTEPDILSSLSRDKIEPYFVSQFTDTMSHVQNSIENEQLRGSSQSLMSCAEEVKNSIRTRAKKGTE